MMTVFSSECVDPLKKCRSLPILQIGFECHVFLYLKVPIIVDHCRSLSAHFSVNFNTFPSLRDKYTLRFVPGHRSNDEGVIVF